MLKILQSQMLTKLAPSRRARHTDSNNIFSFENGFYMSEKTRSEFTLKQAKNWAFGGQVTTSHHDMWRSRPMQRSDWQSCGSNPRPPLQHHKILPLHHARDLIYNGRMFYLKSYCMVYGGKGWRSPPYLAGPPNPMYVKCCSKQTSRNGATSLES